MFKKPNTRFAPIKMLSIECEGFSYLPRQEILIHDSITGSVGENGSGKTTFLNMIRVLLGAIRFDNEQTLHTFFEREDMTDIYIVGKFDNSHHLQYGKRPFENIGKYNEIVSIVCKLHLDYPSVKRHYLIYDGTFDLEADLKKSHRWLEANQYREQMEEVGLSRALINAFSLSQGNTEEILKKDEEQLAEYLLEICGERERIINFQNIKSEVKRQKEQFATLLNQKEMEEIHSNRLQERIERCKQIIEKEDLINKITFNLPISKYVENLEALNSCDKKLKDLQTVFYQIGNTIAALESERQDKEAECNNLASVNKKIDMRIASLYEKRISINKKTYKIQNHVSEIEQFLKDYRDIAPVPREVLEQDKQIKEETYHKDITALKVTEEKKRELTEKIEVLQKNGSIIYPSEIQKMQQILRDKGVEHLLLADCIEIIDEEWVEAVEALLGQERFTIVVSDSDIVKVMHWAQGIKYPYWISPYNSNKFNLHPNSIMHKINILDERISGYLDRFKDYIISDSLDEAWSWIRKGKNAILNKPYTYKVVARGGRYIKSNGKYCGKLAYKSQLEECESELIQLTPVYNQLLQRACHSQSAFNAVIDDINIQNKVALVPEKVQLLQKLKLHEEKILELSNKVKKILDEKKLMREEIMNCVNVVENRMGTINGTLNQLGVQKESTSNEISIKESSFKVLTQKLHDSEGLLSDEQKTLLKDEKYTSDLSPSSHYEIEIKNIDQNIYDLRKINSVEKIDIGEEKQMVSLEYKYKQHQKLLKQHMQEIERVQSELEQLEEKHRIVQEEYYLMVEDIFKKIKYSLEELCKIGNIKAELRAFHVGEDRWKVDYRIGFHGKDPKSYTVRTGLSGGQKVIASLLLTFAAIKSDGSLSFMILDEPFAHLDHERINLAGEFLKNTGVQFVIAMPYSENIKLLMPWVDMILNFRPKKPTEEVAPPITYGVINDEYLSKRSIG